MNRQSQSSQKKKKSKKQVEYDPLKRPCQYIVTKKVDNVMYGRKCFDKCCDDSDKCADHADKINKKYDILLTDLCKHIITQPSRNADRTGMICNGFLFGSNDKYYCKDHINKHADKEDTIMQTFKVRYYPSSEQKDKLKHYFGCTRFTYNKCVQEKYTESFENIRDKIVTYKSQITAYDKLQYKQIIGNKLGELKFKNDTFKIPILAYNTIETKNFIDKNNFLLKCPKEIRAFGVTEYVTGYKEALDKYDEKIESNEWKKQQNIELGKNKYKIKDIKKPEMKFRTKKGDQSITINKNSVKIKDNKIIIYPEVFDENSLNIRSKCLKKDKKLRKVLENGVVYHDIKIIKTNTNEYYVCITTDEKREHPTIDENKFGSYDPGGRTFLTGYSMDEVTEIGPDMNKLIGLIHKQIDENKQRLRKLYILLLETTDEETKEIIQNKIDYRRTKHKTLNRKLRNMITDMHNKAITKLLINDVVYIPKLNTKKIVEQKNYPKQSKRIINALRHGSFIKNLLNKGEIKGKKIKIVSEHLTTKICDACFERNEIGASTIYLCNHCKNEVGRDIHSSKMILLRQIKEIRWKDGCIIIYMI